MPPEGQTLCKKAYRSVHYEILKSACYIAAANCPWWYAILSEEGPALIRELRPEDCSFRSQIAKRDKIYQQSMAIVTARLESSMYKVSLRQCDKTTAGLGQRVLAQGRIVNLKPA